MRTLKGTFFKGGRYNSRFGLGFLGFWRHHGGARDTGDAAGHGKHHRGNLSLFNIMLNLMLSHALSMLYLCSIYAPSMHHPFPVYVLKGREGHEGREGQSMHHLCPVHTLSMPHPYPLSIPHPCYLRCIYAVSTLYLCCIYTRLCPLYA